MPLSRTCLAGAIIIAGFGCSSGSGGGGSSGPVAATPMRGTVGGKDFVAMSARARKSASKPDRKSIDVYDTVVGCKGSPAGALRYITLSVPWQSGFATDFSLGSEGQVGSFVIGDDKGGVTFNVSIDGRIEVADAPPQAGAKGRIRLRMSEDKGDSVEGEIAVDVCE